MNQTELSRYIFTQLQQSLTPDDIATQLRTAGWPEADIATGFMAAQSQLTPTPTEGAPSQTPVQLPPPIARGRIKTGWLLFKQSIRVIKDNPGLSRYMIMSMVYSLTILAIVAVIVIFDITHDQVLYIEETDAAGDSTIYPTLPGLIILIAMGYISTVITYYYGTALSAHVLGIFRGTQSTYREYIALARKRLPAIATYALIATIVGYILRAIEERFKFVGVIVARIFGALWVLATSFVLPIIADTNENGLRAIKQSGGLFKANWGETITGRVTLTGLLVILYLLIGIPLTIVLAVALGTVAGMVGVIIAIILFFIGIVVISVLEILATNILNVSLYYYAKYKVIPPSFSPELLASVFVDKKKKK
jgi:ABC-type multidrug transport system fused ATPase/permease subunit